MKTRILCLPGARPVLIAADLIQRNFSFAYFTDRQNQYIFTVYADVSEILPLTEHSPDNYNRAVITAAPL